MTTQPSDWAVRTAFLELTEAPAYEVLNTHFREEVLNRARELDASGGGPDPLGYTAIFNAIAAATWPAQEGVAINVSVAKFHESIGGNVYATPRAAEAGDKVSIDPSAAEFAVTVAEEWKVMFADIPGLEKYERFTYGPAVDDLIEELRAAMTGGLAGD